MAYLHGVEVIEMSGGARPVRIVTSAVIALVSIAPFGNTNELILVQNEEQASQFGIAHPLNPMRRNLSQIFKQGNATVVCVNVFDAGQHTIAITNDQQGVRGGKFKLSYLYLQDNSLEISTVGGSPTTLVDGTDYTYDPDTQTVTILSTALYPDSTLLNCEYNSITDDFGDVSDSELIGTTSGTVSTGFQLLDKCESRFGFKPRIIISPWFSERPAVAAEMIARATVLRGHAILEAEKGMSVGDILQGRGSIAGDVKNFYTSSKRAILLHLWVRETLPYITGDNEGELVPASAFLAGAMAVKDDTRGFWYSVDNTPIAGIIGAEDVLSFDLGNPNTETNLLNGAGVTTLASRYGSGFFFWGGRSAAFPTDTAIDNFVCVRRAADIIEDSLQQATVPFIGEPLTQAVIDDIRATGNAFLRTLQARGAIIDGEVTFLKSDNPDTELAQGHLTLRLTYLPPAQLERLTFKSFLDISLYSAIGAQ